MSWIAQPDGGHRWVDWSPHPARVPPPAHDHGGRCDAHLYALLAPDRLELGHGWCWTSGHAERYEEAVETVHERGEASQEQWSATVRRALTGHLGPEASRGAIGLLEPKK